MNNLSTFTSSVQPVRAANGFIVGSIEGQTLKKQVKASKHMLREPKGWAWDVCVLEQAESKGVTHTEIYDKEAGVVFRAKLADFWTRGVKLDRGFGPQICLPIAFWQVRRPGDDSPRQLSLAL